MKKDIKYIFGFAVIGLLVSFIFSGPLRKTQTDKPQLGTDMSEKVYARGVVRLASVSEEQLEKTPFLFIIARPLGQAGGPPLAVKRYIRPRYPFNFKLAQGDNMVGDEFFEGDLSVTFRLDADGLAMPPQAEDLSQEIEVKAADNRVVEVTF